MQQVAPPPMEKLCPGGEWKKVRPIEPVKYEHELRFRKEKKVHDNKKRQVMKSS